MNTSKFHANTRLATLLVLALLTAVLAACTPAPPEQDDDVSGTLVVIVNGLPVGAEAAVSVSGTGGYSEQLTASDTLGGLVVGTYFVSATDVDFEGIEYAGSVTGSPANVTPNGVATATVTYAATSVAPGSLDVAVAGLPGGVDAAITVDGPSGTQIVTASDTLVGLEPGVYTVTAADVDDGGDVYAATVVSSPVTVPAGGAAAVSVSYSFLDPTAFGSLAVTITGLPVGVEADVSVSGPGGFAADLTASATLTDLTPGNYDVAAQDVSDDGLSYTAVIETSPVLVIPEATSAVSVTYLPVAVDDGDSPIDPAWIALFRNTSGAPVRVEEALFNGADPLDVKGIQIANEIGDPEDPGDWLAFELIHGQGAVTAIDITLECLTEYVGGSPIRVELRDESGAKLGQTITCDSTRKISIPAVGGTPEYLLSIVPTFSQPYYMQYVVSVDAFCFQACVYQPYEP